MMRRWIMDHRFKPHLDWMVVIVSAVALTASIIYSAKATRISKDSLAVSQKTLKIQRRHDELSIQPILDFQYKFGISAVREDSGFLTLVNVGEGPARITRIAATFRGKPIRTDVDSLADISRGRGLIPRTLRVGQSIGSGRGAMIFGIPARNLSPGAVCPADRARKEFFQELQILVEYESLYEKRDTARFQYRSTNKSNCGGRSEYAREE
jgi:hypothetical protein